MAATRTYEVQEGDSLWHIARETDIDVPALCLANRIGDPSLIYRGQELLLPDTRTRRYVTKKGDTVADLSLKFAVPATELAAKNHVAQGDVLGEGIRLVIPRKEPPMRLQKLGAGHQKVPLPTAPVHDRSSFFGGRFVTTKSVAEYRETPRVRRLLRALRWVESSDMYPAPKGDDGFSRGPLQISLEYHTDAWEGLPTRHLYSYDHCEELDHAEDTVIQYWLRYKPWYVPHASVFIPMHAFCC
eukprot:scaffold956_cov533-Prasinococcus_capsulatus_cf.AAC.7